MGKAKEILKKDYVKCATTRIFENGDLALVRIPGMTNKLSESWEGPNKILKKVIAVNYAIGIPGKNKRKSYSCQQYKEISSIDCTCFN